jgi:hypothetical protein
VFEGASGRRNDFSIDLESGLQSPVAAGLDGATRIIISSDGRQIAYSIAEGDRYSIRVGGSGSTRFNARSLCDGCGRALRFSADGRYLMFQPEARVKDDPQRRHTVHLLDLASGADRPWLEHPTGSINLAGPFGADSAWVAIRVALQPASRLFAVPWRPEPVPPSEWVEITGAPPGANYATAGNFFQFFAGEKLMAIRFDPRTRSVSAPEEVKFLPGTAETPKANESWLIRGPGLVFSRQQQTSSAWLMKLPE